MLADICAFLVAIWHEWKTLLTGGTIIAIAWLIQTARDKTNPQSINWLIVGVTLICAAFLAWRKERNERLSDDSKKVRIKVLKLLSETPLHKVAYINEQTGSTIELLVEMHAAGELYLANGWVRREKPTPRPPRTSRKL
jgi:hypothetical protein